MNATDRPASREARADLECRRLTRDERKALRSADLAECTPERRAELKAAAERAIAHIDRGHAAQRANGVAVSQAQRDRNVASHVLTLECLAD
jgi:hypothetical protein